MKQVLVIHGPNLNLLGKREPEIYGYETLAEIDAALKHLGHELGVAVDTFQSNHEGDIVDRLQTAMGAADAVLINPAAYTHTSVAIRDALFMLEIPIVEVHLSNIYKREPFRHTSLVSDIATGQIAGLGAMGYRLGLQALVELLG
ncbi:MAG: type II 3-dehydroquinate dehydratase [Deltaproteobacteria bacterium]|nr:MAG: type II 3-dehydroquinate dehydratase [Deltaproteobacteria bacterium]